jgi:hypothetical protein
MNLLGYLNDHLAGAAAGIQLAERCRDRDPESELGQVLQALVLEIRHDRDVLECGRRSPSCRRRTSG